MANTVKENDSNKNEIVIQRIEDVISNLKDGKSTLYFFVVDSKNIPNGICAYTYNMALTLQKSGYSVKMLYQLDDEYTEQERRDLEKAETPLDESRYFVGSVGWLGEEFSVLEHLNISKEQWTVSPADFLFIPEALTTLMSETQKNHIPCKRYVIAQNFNYVSEFIPMGDEWATYGITDAIVTTNRIAEDIKSIFPYVKTTVVSPMIPDYFRKPVAPKKLIVGIIGKSKNDVMRIVKIFHWKYPVYRFVAFRDLRGFPREQYAELLKECAITIWMDDETSFGYGAVEAMRCGNIVIGKIPSDIPDWMGNGETLYDNGIWFNNLRDVPEMLASVIGAWMNDEIPTELTDAMTKTNELYTPAKWEETIKTTFDNIFATRIEELTQFKESIQNNITKTEA